MSAIEGDDDLCEELSNCLWHDKLGGRTPGEQGRESREASVAMRMRVMPSAKHCGMSLSDRLLAMKEVRTFRVDSRSPPSMRPVQVSAPLQAKDRSRPHHREH